MTTAENCTGVEEGIGALQGKKLVIGHKALNTSWNASPCRLTLSFNGRSLLVKEQGYLTCEHGAQCTFDGVLIRAK